MKKCPSCQIELHAKQIGPVEVDECSECQGLWFDQGEFKQAKDAVDPDLGWMDFELWMHEHQFAAEKSEVICPVCDEPTVALQYGESNLQVDHCPSCDGTWIHSNEFGKIIEALEADLLNKSFDEYVHESVKEAKDIVTGKGQLATEWRDMGTLLRLLQYRLLIERPKFLDALLTIQGSNPLP